MHGCRDGLFATLPAKLASLGAVLASAALIEKTELAAPLFIFVGTVATLTGATRMGAHIACSQMDERRDSFANAVIYLSALTAGAAAVTALGILPPSLLALGITLAGVVMLGMQTRCGPKNACLRITLVLVVVAAGLAAASAFERRMKALSAADDADNAASFYAKQIAALTEALITELSKGSTRNLGPSVRRDAISLRRQTVTALQTFPFYAAAAVGISGYAGLALRPATGARRYDEYLTATLASCSSDTIKGLVGTLLLLRQPGARIREGRELCLPNDKALRKIPTRFFLLTARNTIFETVATNTGSQEFGMVLSQFAYALFSVLRDPFHESIERGLEARRPAAPATGAALEHEPAALRIWQNPPIDPPLAWHSV